MNIGRVRQTNQHISRPTLDDPAALVHWFGAVQAQDYLGGLWAVGLRMRSATEASVEAAIARREIVRTWPMRGTLHFVAAEDVRWILPLLTPRVISATASRYRSLELTGPVFTRAAKVAEKALEGGKTIRRDALYELWSAAGVATHDSRGLHLLGHLSQTGLLCFGARDGKQQTFALLEEWVPAMKTFARDEALGHLALRYFTSHGPASVHDFAWWSGLTITESRAAVGSVASRLDSEDVDGRTLWFAASQAARSSRTAYLLPAWDEFTVAYRDRNDILDPAHAKRVNAGGGVLKPVIVVDGQVLGTWQRRLGKKGVTISATYFAKQNRPSADAIAGVTKRYAAFLGVRVDPTSAK
jgi:hypothetical protein